MNGWLDLLEEIGPKFGIPVRHLRFIQKQVLLVREPGIAMNTGFFLQIRLPASCFCNLIPIPAKQLMNWYCITIRFFEQLINNKLQQGRLSCGRSATHADDMIKVNPRYDLVN